MNPVSYTHLDVYKRQVTGNAPSADGAACVIVCPTEMAKKYTDKPVEVLGIGASCLELMRPHNEMEITKEAARQVYQMTRCV